MTCHQPRFARELVTDKSAVSDAEARNVDGVSTADVYSSGRPRNRPARQPESGSEWDPRAPRRKSETRNPKTEKRVVSSVCSSFLRLCGGGGRSVSRLGFLAALHKLLHKHIANRDDEQTDDGGDGHAIHHARPMVLREAAPEP